MTITCTYNMSTAIFVFAALLASAQGFCFTDRVRTSVSKYGTITQFCVYKGLEMTVGSHIETTECMQCACTARGLSCCGTGIRSGVIMPQQGCKVVPDGCKPMIVMEKDETKDCFTGKNLVKDSLINLIKQ